MHLLNDPDINLSIRVHSIASGDSLQTQTLQDLIESDQDRKLDIHLYNIGVTIS